MHVSYLSLVLKSPSWLEDSRRFFFVLEDAGSRWSFEEATGSVSCSRA